jgi:hypothetical protein
MDFGAVRMKLTAHLWNAQQGHAAYTALWNQIKPHLIAGWRLRVTVEQEKRSIDQNSAQWPILDAFSKQLQWPVNGHMVTMAPEEWKEVLSAGFKKEQVRLAMGLDGGVVMLGKRTSKFTKAEFSEWLDFLNATAALRGVDLEPVSV